MKIKITQQCFLNGRLLEVGTIHEVDGNFPFMHAAKVVEEPAPIAKPAAPAEVKDDAGIDGEPAAVKPSKMKKEK